MIKISVQDTEQGFRVRIQGKKIKGFKVRIHGRDSG
jgi:hypothetical protein